MPVEKFHFIIVSPDQHFAIEMSTLLSVYHECSIEMVNDFSALKKCLAAAQADVIFCKGDSDGTSALQQIRRDHSIDYIPIIVLLSLPNANELANIIVTRDGAFRSEALKK